MQTEAARFVGRYGSNSLDEEPHDKRYGEEEMWNPGSG